MHKKDFDDDDNNNTNNNNIWNNVYGAVNMTVTVKVHQLYLMNAELCRAVTDMQTNDRCHPQPPTPLRAGFTNDS